MDKQVRRHLLDDEIKNQTLGHIGHILLVFFGGCAPHILSLSACRVSVALWLSISRDLSTRQHVVCSKEVTQKPRNAG
jgi:hypothetical protein